MRHSVAARAPGARVTPFGRSYRLEAVSPLRGENDMLFLIVGTLHIQIVLQQESHAVYEDILSILVEMNTCSFICLWRLDFTPHI